MTNDDDDIWKLYSKGVKKIRKTKTADAKSAVVFPPRSRGFDPKGSKAEGWLGRDWKTQDIGISPPSVPPASGREAQTAQISLDRRIEKNLRQGEIALEARIDLHGMTQTEAYESLARFMATQVKAGKRNLLIITGKGRGNEGILKTNLPHWLHTLPEATKILTLRPAAAKHGGSGAFYLLLRKIKCH